MRRSLNIVSALATALCAQLTLDAALMGVAMAEDARQECSRQLTEFLTKLDEILPVAQAINPMQNLIRDFFPLKVCNVEDVVRISKQSKYFDHIQDAPKDMAVFFRHKPPHRWGFVFSFGVDKSSGDSKLPAVMVDYIKS
jgi:hypothetical protein